MSTDEVYLYPIQSRYSLTSSFITTTRRGFPTLSTALDSLEPSSSLITSVRISALKRPSAPSTSSERLTAKNYYYFLSLRK